MRQAPGITLLSGFFLCCQAFAGAVLQTETKEYHVDPPAIGSTEMFADGTMLRIEINSISSGEDGLVIYRGDRNEMIVTDAERREYYVIDQQSMGQMAGQVSEAMKQMEEALKAMSPEERAMAERMMKQQMPGLQRTQKLERTLRKTGESDTINGYDCEYFEILKQGRKTQDMCVAKWNDIEGGPEAADAMIAMGKFFQSMHDAFASGAGVDLMGEQDEFFAHMRELGGFPIYTRDYDDSGALESESSLKTSRLDSIDAAKFEPPEGYRKMDMRRQ